MRIASEESTVKTVSTIERKPGVKSSLPSLFRKHKDIESSKIHQEVPMHLRGVIVKDYSLLLEESLNNSVELPTGFIECKFFNLSASFYFDLEGQINYQTIKYLHPLLKLLENDSNHRFNYIKSFESYLDLNQNAMIDYKFFEKYLSLLNDLAVMWDLINLHNYRHRFQNDIEEINIFDLKDLYKQIFSLEIIWMCYAVRVHPLCKVLSTEIKEVAILLEKEFARCLEALMESNQEFILQTESLESWLSYLNPVLHTKFSFAPPKNVQVKCQSFRINYFKGLCCKAEGNALRLRQILIEFEFVYREFEGMLIKSLKDLKAS